MTPTNQHCIQEEMKADAIQGMFATVQFPVFLSAI
jgi:hypothetical protein